MRTTLSRSFGALARAFGLAFAVLASVAHAQQTTVSLTATADNTMYSESGSVSNGIGTFMFTGRTNNGDIRRALVKFDLSSIPTGSTIDSVSLAMTMSRANNNTSRATTVHRVLADWGQGTSDATQGGEGQGIAATANDATWTFRFFNTQSWSTAGGEFNATASATTNVGAAGSYTWTSAAMLADVQAWFTTPATNFGWVVRGNETTNASAKRFNTREFATASQRPILSVTYTPPTGACCINGVCSIVSAASCASSGGTYQGNNTVCSPNPCPAPTGACCISGACSIQTLTACSAAGGTYQGNGTNCTTNPCTSELTLTVGASKDNTLYETTDGSLSNGAGIGFIVGRGTNVNQRRRGVIAFNVSSIPANATITSARLRLAMGFTADTATRAFSAHRLLADWGEGTSNAANTEVGGATSTTNDATWIHRFFNTQTWTTAGGQFNATASATTNVATTLGFYEWTSSGLAADVQAWIAAPSSNFGWILIGGEANGGSQRRFESRTNGTAANRPQLIVTYTLPPATGACCVASGTCTVLTQAQCLASGGSYGGNNTTCSPNPCPQPTGACCLPSGTCSVLTAAACSTQGGTYNGNGSLCGAVSCPIVLTPFVDALPIPAIAQPTSGQPGGAANYSINMVEFNATLHRDLPPTRVWGYNGIFPGPTIEAHRDQPVNVTWVNNLRDLNTGLLRTSHYFPVDTCLHGPSRTGTVPVTVVHFHGGHVAPDSDGDPDLAFPPGQSSPVYHYPNDQRATTLWYHDHALGITRLNVYMGLAGAYVLRDTIEDSLNLPRGEFEIPLIIQDRSFNPDGSLLYHNQWMDHFFGKFVLVNGKVWPFLNVKRGKYRFRLVNGSNTRIYTLALSNGATFQQIGSDQGLLPAPVTLSSLTFAPGERADIVIDFAPFAAGTRIVLTNSAPAPFPNGDVENEVPNVMRFNVIAAAGDTDPLPASLTSVPRTPESDSVFTRSFTLRNMIEPVCNHDSWLINDLKWDDITDFPRAGTTEIWSFINRSSITHPIHVHLVSFQLLDRQAVTIVNDVPVPTGPRILPTADEAGWKDVIRTNPFEVTRVIMRFEGFSGLYPMHCHILEHEDHEMMRLFRVLCDPPVVTTPPAPFTASVGGSATFSTSVTGDELKYEWRRNAVKLQDGPGISGSATATLMLSNVQPASAGLYDCVIIGTCGNATTNSAQLTVGCVSDFNGDGEVNPDDLADYIGCYFGQPPCGTADFNQDGEVNPDDLADFIGAYFGGC